MIITGPGSLVSRGIRESLFNASEFEFIVHGKELGSRAFSMWCFFLCYIIF